MRKNRWNQRVFTFILSGILVVHSFSSSLSINAFATQINHKPQIVSDEMDESNTIYVSGAFCVDLRDLFFDEDGDELTFYIKLNEQAYRKAEPMLQFIPENSEKTVITLKASDGELDSEECVVVIQAEKDEQSLEPATLYNETVLYDTKAVSVGAQPEEVEASWANFRNSDYNMAITDVKTPRNEDASKVAAKWIQNYKIENDYPSVFIIVEDYLIAMRGTTLYQLDKNTGEVVKQTTMSAKPNFGVVPPVYGAGMIFCPLANGSIQAFNAKTLESLWIYKDALKGQSLSPITYANGYIYTGFWNAETKDANFVCISVKDEDVTKTDEEKKAVWSYTHMGGFYWAGAVVVGNAVIVGSDDGVKESGTGSATLYAFDKKTGAIISQVELASDSGDQRSSIAYDKPNGKIYFTTKKGYLYSAKVDGTTGKISDVKGQKYEGASTSTPVVYKGRVYFGLGNGFKEGYIVAADADSLKEIYRVTLKGYPQNSVLLSTAYEASEGYLYLYSTYNYYPGGISVIKVKSDSTSASDVTLTELYTPEGDYQQYCITSLICDESGTIYYKNDSGNLFAIGIPSYENVIQMISEIGTVTVDSESKIKAARDAYDALSDADKKLVTNYSTLTSAESQLSYLSVFEALKTEIEKLKDTVENLTKSESTSGNKDESKENTKEETKKDNKENSKEETKQETKENTAATVTTTPSTIYSAKQNVVTTNTQDSTAVEKSELLQFSDELTNVSSDIDYDTALTILKDYYEFSEEEQLAFADSDELLLLQEIVSKEQHIEETTGIKLNEAPWNVQLFVEKPVNEAIAAEISSKYDNGSLLCLWNIYLEDILTTGKYEPEEPVKLQIPVTVIENYENYDGFEILHYKDDGSIEILNCENINGYLQFHTLEFSYYAVIGKEKETVTTEIGTNMADDSDVMKEDMAETTNETSWTIWALLGGIGLLVAGVLVYYILISREEEREQTNEKDETNVSAC